MSNLLDSALQLFFEEAAEHLALLEEGLLSLDKDPGSREATIERLFRSAHTIKGSANLMKLRTVGAVAHRLEDTLETLRDQRRLPTRPQVDAMLFALDQIRSLLDCAAEKKTEPAGVVEKIDRLLAGAETEGDPKAAGKPEPLPIFPESREDEGEFPTEERRSSGRREEEVTLAAGGVVKVRADQLEKMMNLVGEITVTKTHLVGQMPVLQQMREEVDFAGRRLLKEVGAFAERYAYSLPEQIRYADPMLSEFKELQFDRYDEINLFTRKLQEITSDIDEALGTLGRFFNGFAGQVEAMDRMVVEIKERISEARTIPAGNLFQRFTRSVRELSRESGKNIQLLVSGGETPIDRVVYDGLYDPLLHILRNAVAHGLEGDEERNRLGKPLPGTITLGARRRGSTVEIEIRDDGRGVQLDRVRERAIEKGFLDPAVEAGEQQLMQMIFKPGFSTAETADATSGRGVGMNVVMDRLAALNGTIEVETRPGEGTTFRLTLPLSLVIINVVQFRVGRQAFVIPSTLVAEITDLPASQEPPETIELRGETLPVLDLGSRLGHPPAETPRRFAIVTQIAGRRVALLVDAIVSQEDTVIRPFGTFLRDLPHFAGTSLAGDGSLRLVLNPARLLEEPPTASAAITFTPTASGPTRTVVLVVDDSISVRKAATLFLNAHGIDTLTASNGLEGLEVLEQSRVDLVITDLEMPVMHGYELLGELKRRGLLPALPVAVLSSRAGEAHRQKAFDLGAVDYLVKPFEEESLVEAVRRNLAHPEKA